MKNNENQLEHVDGALPAVTFHPCTYRQYIAQAKKMYSLNIEEVETYLALEEKSRIDGLNIAKNLEYSFGFFRDLLNQDYQHGNYRPDAWETRCLLAWMQGTKALCKKLSDSILVEEEEQ
ncbi:hypothetical protein RE773_000394 [Salmonella enterica]|nr:hypothetical protein [Salmonella enterica]EKY8868057.1 hypothetical protein [Salmonella enterica]EKY8978675.1 hypothetical protein [Salmonella enterica]EKZ8156286.1 hypothetical protein [Salmonella enterica]ELF2381140.1 hypothetical protein [Salmonella enterica]